MSSTVSVKQQLKHITQTTLRGAPLGIKPLMLQPHTTLSCRTSTQSPSISCLMRPCSFRPSLVVGRGGPRLFSLVLAQSNSNGSGPKTPNDRMDEVKKTLNELGIDNSTAKKVLKIWREAGASDAAGLRKLLIKKSANKAGALVTQLVLDAFSANITFYTAIAVSRNKSEFGGPFNLAVQYALFVVAMYLTLSAFLDVFAIIALGVATARYSANSAAFLEAVEKMAGPDTGLTLADKAKKAVVTIKVLAALEQILQMLKQGAADAPTADFFRDLGSYLQLQRAMDQGFDWEQLGISPASAADIAAEFDTVDQNGDGKLDESEFKLLCAKAVPFMSEEEVTAAMTVLDKTGNGSVDLPEFMAWWVTGISKDTAPKTEQ